LSARIVEAYGRINPSQKEQVSYNFFGVKLTFVEGAQPISNMTAATT